MRAPQSRREYPTGGLATLALAGPWRELDRGGRELKQYFLLLPQPGGIASSTMVREPCA